jgi:hypothetical protein
MIFAFGAIPPNGYIIPLGRGVDRDDFALRV